MTETGDIRTLLQRMSFFLLTLLKYNYIKQAVLKQCEPHGPDDVHDGGHHLSNQDLREYYTIQGLCTAAGTLGLSYAM